MAGVNELLGRGLQRITRIERHELAAVTSAFLLFFFVLGGYFAVRPVRETIGTILGRAETQSLWLYTAAFALAFVPLYGALVAKVRRTVLLPSIYGGVAALLLMAAWLLATNERNPAFGKLFYVFISVVNLMLVSVFWSFLLELFTSEQTKRLFGAIAAGGTVGALAGPLLTSRLVETIGNPGVLVMGSMMFVVALFLQRRLLAHRQTDAATAAAAPDDRALGGNPFAGFKLVFSSKYLFGIMLFVVGVSALNTFLYFEQLEAVEEAFEATSSRTRVFANLDAIVQALVIGTQLFLTGRIATRFGVTALLVTIPVVMIFGLLAFAWFQGFTVLAIAMVVRRWGEYAFIRPGREMLFSKVDKESKYKAKNLIDVGVYRVADAGFAQAGRVVDGLNVAGPTQAVWVAGLSALWALNGWWLGRQHRNKAG